MTVLSKMKIADLKAINSAIGLSNRRSKDENITQIVDYLSSTYNIIVDADQLTFEHIGLIIDEYPKIKSLDKVTKSKILSEFVAGTLPDTLSNRDKLVYELLSKGIINEVDLGDTTSEVVINEELLEELTDDEQLTSESEEEEDPDPAIRYKNNDDYSEDSDQGSDSEYISDDYSDDSDKDIDN